ncbi:MAG: HEAT repeat domain-containing protein [Cyanobacteria bacterium SZAS LIN-3]|nr:HEAT repeat domain-containing protein [Cyanobacteria bacterium SZAS LIN-3]
MHKNLSHLHPNNFRNYLEAGLEQTPNRKLRELAEHGHPKIRARVAENAKTPAILLSRLAQDPSAEVRIAVAQNQAITPAIRLKLTADEDPNVRYAIAEDATVPVEILQILMDDEHPYVSHRAHKTFEKVAGMNKKAKKLSSRERLMSWRSGGLNDKKAYG